ncbi:LytR/AlgR family response regulator transcription factor [Roseateles sp. BYS180W]|uniref:LytR/AlgR family response regulator transcription factor n=1 Tax=Roseateles rivi TaxID=3299028 RepID=A0ABW7FT96_9BURK
MNTRRPLALVADDEPVLAQRLCKLLSAQWPELELLPVVHDGLTAARMIEEQQPDVAFLDIQMPGLSGLEVAQGIEGATRVVFVTAYDQYALAAFEEQALDYLLKPVEAQRLARTVARLRQALQAPPQPDSAALLAALQRLQPSGAAQGAALRYIRASQGEQTHQLPVEDVIYFHADDKYTCVRTARGEYLIRTPIHELVAQLDAQQFWQVHRSTVVNLAQVAGTRRDEASRLFVRFHGASNELPVSRAYVHLFKAM